jgi:hypothetical protein
MEIVYCGDCGRSLRRDDFLQKRAGYQNDVPYCSECRPVKGGDVSSGTLKKISVTSRAPRVAPPPTARRVAHEAPARPSRAPLVIGLVVAGAAVAAGAAVVLLKDREEPAEKVTVKVTSIPGQGTPGKTAASEAAEAERVREEERSREARKQRELEAQRRAAVAQFEAYLSRVAEIRGADPGFARSAEVLELLKSALEVAGSRKGEVEQLRAAYEKALGEVRQKALSQRKGPYDLDGSGNIQNWLIAGPFPNNDDKGFYVDFLKTEEQHEPADGKEVPKEGGKVRWAPYRAEGGRVNFFEVPHLGLSDKQPFVIQYAACWLELDRDLDLELRLGSDDGFRLWVDGELRTGAHVHRGVKEDEDTCAIRLSRGIHLVLLKVDQGDGDHGFVVRVTTPDGNRPAGVRVWN